MITISDRFEMTGHFLKKLFQFIEKVNHEGIKVGFFVVEFHRTGDIIGRKLFKSFERWS